MVSLRTNLWGLRYAAGLAATIFMVVGGGLSALAVAGRVLHGTSLEESSADPVLKDYVAFLRGGGSFDLDRANRIVYLATTHSDDRRIALTENWLHWSLGKLYAPLARTQNAERLMAGSLANCSERSEILKSLAESTGHRCRFIGLSGHVVLEVESSGSWQVADPDYGVVYPCTVRELEQPAAAARIRRTLADVGYPPPNVDLYLGIVQSADDNIAMAIGSPLSPRLDVVERWCDWLALPLPLAMLATGLILARAASVVRNRRSHWQWSDAISQAACEIGPQPRRA